jgi:hypothetical protein
MFETDLIGEYQFYAYYCLLLGQYSGKNFGMCS